MIMIWSVVLYKVVNVFGADTETVELSINAPVREESLLAFAKDTFDLKDVERDPFLGKISSRKIIKKGPVNPKEVISKKTSKQNAKKSLKLWPKLEYYGFIKSTNKASKLILIKIDNKLHKIRQGESIEEIKIKKVYRDSILIQKAKEVKVIKKKK